jgi:hypothetical protein
MATYQEPTNFSYPGGNPLNNEGRIRLVRAGRLAGANNLAQRISLIKKGIPGRHYMIPKRGYRFVGELLTGPICGRGGGRSICRLGTRPPGLALTRMNAEPDVKHSGHRPSAKHIFIAPARLTAEFVKRFTARSNNHACHGVGDPPIPLIFDR